MSDITQVTATCLIQLFDGNWLMCSNGVTESQPMSARGTGFAIFLGSLCIRHALSTCTFSKMFMFFLATSQDSKPYIIFSTHTALLYQWGQSVSLPTRTALEIHALYSATLYDTY